MSFPAFTKLGSKFSDPTWLTTLSSKIMFPRVFDNDAHRAALPGLPASAFSCIYSSDHSSGTGYWGRVDFDDIEGTWTDAGQVFSGANQLEAVHPVFDHVHGGRVLVYAHHGATNGATYNDQSQRVFTTTDLSNFTLLNGNPLDYGNHTGYQQVFERDGRFVNLHCISGAEVWQAGRSFSDDGETYTFDRKWLQSPTHVVGSGYCCQGCPFVFKWADQWYWITTRATRPRSSAGANVAVIAIPIDWETLRPIGGYYTLLEVSGTTTDPDYRLRNEVAMYEIGDDIYLVYMGNTNAGVQHVCLAKANGSEASYTAPAFPIAWNGRLSTPPKRTALIDWDAANDAMPSSLAVNVVNGTNASSQSAGNYYEFASGSGTTDLRLQQSSAIDINGYDVVEWTLRDLRLSTDSAGSAFQWGIIDSWANQDGLLFNGSNDVSYEGGRARVFINHSNTGFLNEATYNWRVFGVSNNIRSYWRTIGIDLTFRILPAAKKALILIDGHVTYTADLSDLSSIPSVLFMPRLIAQDSYMRFSRFSIYTHGPGTAALPSINSGLISGAR